MCPLQLGSADGIPNAIGVGGEGEGDERVIKGGSVVPRNTLALWGRGSPIFKTFFWDGKVDFANGKSKSQFGSELPSDDPLIVTIHLPVVEIREMLAEDKFVGSQKKEKVTAAEKIYAAVVDRLKNDHKTETIDLAGLRQKSVGELGYIDVAISIKEFFKRKFAVKPHKFNEFVFNNKTLKKGELEGAALFYGKGKCGLCHSGPLFSDLNFYTIPFRQLGSGKNGFGVDYGRFDVTHNPSDLYKFRTPPLLNVSKTAPYGHSGSIGTPKEAIFLHFDPLRRLETASLSSHDRIELFKRIASSSQALHSIATLDEEEVENLAHFLKTLDF
ncbi:MAG: methylamine utilization protein MauG [Rhodospirillaceae bacterium]|nr:methylamine utilization protein MauG [Rhodospirillaceae bacterium]